MAFGQPSGPPATARQLRELTALLHAAGHSSFREARGPLGLTQRQGGGRFTQEEAASLIARLEAEAEEQNEPDGPSDDRPVVGSARAIDRATPRVPAGTRAERLARQLEQVPEEMLVEELRRRGWALIPPSLAN
jgi:hypothetical protein